VIGACFWALWTFLGILGGFNWVSGASE